CNWGWRRRAVKHARHRPSSGCTVLPPRRRAHLGGLIRAGRVRTVIAAPEERGRTMAYFVVQVVSAQPDSPVRVGQTVAEFATEAEAGYFCAVARSLRSFQRCTLGVRKEAALPKPAWMVTAAQATCARHPRTEHPAPAPCLRSVRVAPVAHATELCPVVRSRAGLREAPLPRHLARVRKGDPSCARCPAAARRAPRQLRRSRTQAWPPPLQRYHCAPSVRAWAALVAPVPHATQICAVVMLARDTPGGPLPPSLEWLPKGGSFARGAPLQWPAGAQGWPWRGRGARRQCECLRPVPGPLISHPAHCANPAPMLRGRNALGGAPTCSSDCGDFCGDYHALQGASTRSAPTAEHAMTLLSTR